MYCHSGPGSFLAASASSWRDQVGLDQRVERAGGGGPVAGRHQRQVALAQQPFFHQIVEQRRVEVTRGRVRLLLRQIAGLDHGDQHLALAAVSVGGRLERVQAGILRDGRQHGDLVERQILDRLVVIDVGRRLDAVRRVAVEVVVQVPFEDLVLAFAAGILARDLDGHDGLFDLARVRLLVALFRVDQDVLDQLLGDGAGALDAAARAGSRGRRGRGRAGSRRCWCRRSDLPARWWRPAPFPGSGRSADRCGRRGRAAGRSTRRAGACPCGRRS